MDGATYKPMPIKRSAKSTVMPKPTPTKAAAESIVHPLSSIYEKAASKARPSSRLAATSKAAHSSSGQHQLAASKAAPSTARQRLLAATSTKAAPSPEIQRLLAATSTKAAPCPSPAIQRWLAATSNATPSSSGHHAQSSASAYSTVHEAASEVIEARDASDDDGGHARNNTSASWEIVDEVAGYPWSDIEIEPCQARAEGGHDLGVDELVEAAADGVQYLGDDDEPVEAEAEGLGDDEEAEGGHDFGDYDAEAEGNPDGLGDDGEAEGGHDLGDYDEAADIEQSYEEQQQHARECSSSSH